MDNKKCGGKRVGAGRPRVNPELKKVMVSLRLSNWIHEWMKSQKGTNKTKLIEEALIQVHKLVPPKVDL